MFAICILEQNENSGVSGIVKFYQEQEGSETYVEATIKGLSKGKHGIHVHQFGNLSKGCETAGPHYNPFGKSHGGPQDSERHIGDMGNIESKGPDTDSILKYQDTVISLYSNSIIGRSVVVHASEDDLGKGGNEESKRTGNAGKRVACGVIGVSDELHIDFPFWKSISKRFQSCWKR